jgi:hypothetical protein
MSETNRGKNEAIMAIILPAPATVQAEDGPFTDDLIVEILSRLPARSVQRFKCVSPFWRDLIADPAHRRKLSQTLAGFLYDTYDSVNSCFLEFHFATVSASTGAAPLVDPSLPFLPPDEYLYVSQIDTCNGLLLGLAHMAPPPSTVDNVMLESHYIVCNPATARWVDLPPHPNPVVSAHMMARLTFDPTISSHFHVLQFAKTDQEHYITGVSIYSSRTRAWNHKETPSIGKFNLYFGSTSVFFHGMLHLLAWRYPMIVQADAVLVVIVDMEGQVWKTIRMPSGGISFG